MSTTTDRLESAIYDNKRQIKNTEDSLRRAAEDMIDKMERLIRNLDENLTINSLGEVQGRGLEVDRLCALRSKYYDFQNMLDYMAEGE